MKIAITSVGDSLSSEVDGRFGRCNYFVVVNPDNMEYEAIANGSRNAVGGAGVEAAQTVSGSGAKALITGNVGPNAYRALSSAGLEIYTGASGTVKDAVSDYKQDNLVAPDSSTTRGGRGKRRR